MKPTLSQPALDRLAKHLGRRVVMQDDKLHEDHYDWVADGRPVLLIPLCSFDRFIGCVDVGEGLDLLWDGSTWHSAKKGIFLPEIVFLTDYYGFPSGQLFIPAPKDDPSEHDAGASA